MLARTEYGVPLERVRADLERMLDEVARRRAVRRWALRRPARPPAVERLARLGPQEWRALLATGFAALCVEAALKLLPLHRTASLLGVRLVFGSPAGKAEPREAGGRATGLEVWATSRVFARWPFGDTCLRRALVLGYHFRDDHPLLRIGVGQGEDGEVVAHAWLETSRGTWLALPGYDVLLTADADASPAAP